MSPEVGPSRRRWSPSAHTGAAARLGCSFGPSTPAAFAKWAGIGPVEAQATFAALSRELTAVRTPIGESWILTRDEPAFRGPKEAADAVRLLPSGDAYFLLHGVDRELLVPDAASRLKRWTSRAWPGAVLVAREVVGTWRRAQSNLTTQPWRRLRRAQLDAVEAAAESLPLPGVEGQIVVRWDD